MTDVLENVARLSPEKQAQLQKILRDRALAGAAADSVRPRPRGGPAPLSFGQHRLWFLHQMDPAGTAYHMPYPLRLRGGLDADALERALAQVVRRHESLRTVFAVGEDGEPMQRVLAADAFAPGRVDLSMLPPAEAEARARALAREEAGRPFDLAAEPAFRAVLARLSADHHVLLLTLHHVASDGWSTGILVREVAALYGAFSRGEPSPLPALPIQYADYAVWQRERMAGDALGRQLAYWRRQLAGAPALLDLPTDRPRPAVPGTDAGSRAFVLPAHTAQRLRALAQEAGATLFTTFLAGFQLLLARYAGTDDVCVGAPVAGRPRVETEGLIGFFVNTLVLRANVSDDPAFRTFLLRVRDTVLDAHAHQDVPFERVVEELAPERSLAGTPFFQAVFTFDAAGPGSGARLGDVAVEPLDDAPPAAKFDLTLGMEEREDGAVEGSFTYRTELFDEPTIRRIADALQLLLAAAAEDPASAVSRLPILAPGERRRVVEAWNATDAAYPRASTIAAVFAEQAMRTPERIALSAGGGTMTYAELDARSNRLAHVLRDAGVGHETRVGVALERSLELPVALLAILKAGGAYVPLDPSYPAERRAWMQADAGVPIVITQASLAASVAADGVTPLVLEDEADAIDAASAGPVEGGATADSLAYVIYTSGSTGTPKGVAVPHRGVLRLVRGNGFASFSEDETFLQLAPVGFDASTLELWGPLLNGGRLALHPPEEPTLEAIARVLRDEGVTTLWLTAGLFHLAVDERMDMLAGLRQLLAGGDVLSPAHVRRVREAHPHLRLINGYGPTESTTFTCCHSIGDGEQGPIPLGAPIANTRVYVVDAAMQPIPVGVPGELLIGGDGLARGYLNRAALTAEKFIPDPFAAAPGGRLYRTGDRVRWRADGTVGFLGRIDQQVKVRGFRIEPGEVEAALLAHPAVHEAVVIVREDVHGDRRLVAYVVGDEASAPALRGHLGGRLPEYMLPSAIVLLDALPLTANGKTDRRALPAPEAGDADEWIAPRTPAEEVLAGIWGEVLGVDRVSAGANFFALGGHSLLATRAISRVRRAFGVEVPLRALFEAPTPAQLALHVAALAADTAAPPPLVPVPRDGTPLPLSFAQQRLWFIDQLQPGDASYNVPLALRTRAPLDADALERALATVVRRHEALRTTFASVDGEPVQVIGPAAFRLERADLSGLGEDAREAAVRQRAADEAARPFDLAAGPVIRGTLLRLADDDHVLLLTFHHVAGDGWSLGVLEREVSALYAGSVAGTDARLPELPIQYADYAAWQRAWISGGVLQAQLAYWRGSLAGAPPLLELPLDRPRPPVQDPRAGSVPIVLPPPLADALRALSRREGATLYMTLLAAFQLLLGRLAGTDDVSVGSPIAGRTRVETEGLIGLFVNTLVLRTDLSGEPGFRALLARVRETVLQAHAHQELPFEKLVEEFNVERSTAHTPLFQASFQLLAARREAAAEEDDGMGWRPLPGERTAVKFDLMLGLSEAGGAVEGGLSYRTELFDEGTIRRMGDMLHVLLAAVAADPERPVSRFDLLGADERRQVVEAWNATSADLPFVPVHRRFEAQADRTPDAAAVVFGAETVSYGELDRRANRIARHLQTLGAGPESRVGILLHRTPEMVAAVLGTLKAGAAYVPLDPAAPAARTASVLADAGASVLLTQASLAEGLPPVDTPVLRLDADELVAHDGRVSVDSGPRALAYVIYTSGSTGRPKGALIEHGGLDNYLAWFDRTMLDGEDLWLPFVSRLSFDASIRQLFPPLLRGGAVWVLPEEVVSHPAKLLREMAGRDSVTFGGVPSLWSAALDAIAAGEAPAPAGLRAVLLGGEALPAELVARTQARFPGVRIHNHYGPTETTVNTTVARVESTDVTIGRPIANVRVYLLDAHGHSVPRGVTGELFVAGAGVGRGYLARPGMTAAAFVPDPFSADAGARMYRSGDRARWRGDGTLEYVGRTDFQLKIRGFRIEPAEIEAALLAHPHVREASVLVREDAPGDRRLVAYVTGERVPASALRDHLRARVPQYMVPSAIVPLERLPLTPNGKLDRDALPAPAPRADAEAVAPRDPVELALARTWARVLGRESVGVRDDFFALGGHSLLAVRLMAAVENAFGRAMPLASLFAAPTVERQAALLRRDGADGAAWNSVVTIQPAGAEPPLFFVHGGGGSVLAYAELARALGTDRPFHALQSAGLAGEAAPRTSVPEMAAAYLRALRAVHPEGPYLLGGWSMGGVVAFEMARQAQAAGDPAARLLLVDSVLAADAAPGAEEDGATREVGRMIRFSRHLGVPLDDAVLYADALRMDAGERLAHLLALARDVGAVPPDFPPARFAALWEVFRTNVAALAAYRPAGPVDAPALLVRAADQRHAGTAGPALGWAPWITGGLRVRSVPGDHFSVVRDPHVHALAAELAAGIHPSHGPVA